MPITEQL